jgi:integrase
MLHLLRLAYFTPAGTREAGFIETDHFGVRFPGRASHVDLTEVTQQWLRDLLWDHLAGLMWSAHRPRSGGPADYLRRACIELSAFLAADAPDGGHDPAVLRAEHAQRFADDQQHRARHGLASRGVKGPGGTPSTVTANTRCLVVNGVRKILRDAMDSGVAERLGLGREFITAIPSARHRRSQARRPFPDEVARALADEANLARFAAGYDPEDQGMRDIWETIVCTGRRVSEVIRLRLDCLGRYGGLPVLWHDQTKVGNLDAAIRIPERLHQILAERQRKTSDRFTARHGRAPAGAGRAALALFPSKICNLDGTASLTCQWFWEGFRSWVDALDIGHYVAHQARHALAANLLRNGATLTHVRRYLGRVSDRMAEHYIHLTNSDLDDVLHTVWVAGPGVANPGKPLTSGAAPMTSEQAQALAIDLSRSSTPAEGGFCTFAPVVDGGACPWNLNCHSCGKFVMSGADLLYWRRKREQWNSIAERAPDDATADYLHQVFAPAAAAIDGLESALTGLGLLDQALALDLRRPQDYFQRIWNLGFRAADLTGAGDVASAGGDPAWPGVMSGAAGERDAEGLEATG